MDPAIARQMEAVEEGMRDRSVYHIPAADLRERAWGIKDGDIIGITALTADLDVLHAGLAVRQDDGHTLHLLHASQQAGKVVVSTETLGDYIRAKDIRTGVMVGRIRL
jgi:hypothetical protein